MNSIKFVIITALLASVISCKKDDVSPQSRTTNTIATTTTNTKTDSTKGYQYTTVYFTISAGDSLYPWVWGGDSFFYQYFYSSSSIPIPPFKPSCSFAQNYNGPPIPIGAVVVSVSSNGGITWKKLPLEQKLPDRDSCSLQYEVGGSGIEIFWVHNYDPKNFNPTTILSASSTFQFKVESTIWYYFD